MKQKEVDASLEVRSILTWHPLFAGVDQAALERLLLDAESLNVPKGEAIYTPYQFRRCLGLLLSGRVQVTKDMLLVSHLGAGDLFGAAALFTDNQDYATTLTALTPCRLVLFPQDGVERLVEESSRFALNYIRYLSSRIQFLSGRLDTVSAGTAEGKLAQYLLSAVGDEEQVAISATQLSARIGVGRSTLYRAFEALEREGAIAREGKVIRILRRELLHHASHKMEHPQQ